MKKQFKLMAEKIHDEQMLPDRQQDGVHICDCGASSAESAANELVKNRRLRLLWSMGCCLCNKRQRWNGAREELMQ